MIFLDAPKKILNKEFTQSRRIPIEISDREEIGIILNNDIERNKITNLLNKITKEKALFREKINQNMNKNIFNIGSSSNVIELNLI